MFQCYTLVFDVSLLQFTRTQNQIATIIMLQCVMCSYSCKRNVLIQLEPSPRSRVVLAVQHEG